MRRAILLAGSESRYSKNIGELRRYLVEESGIYCISTIDANEVGNEAFLNRFVHAISNIGNEPTLILYNGHGLPDGWYYKPNTCFSYEQIVDILSSVRAPLMIINDCCHSHAIAEHLKMRRWHSPIGLISASPFDQTSSSFNDQVSDSWGRYKAFDPKDYTQEIIYIGSITSLERKEKIIETSKKKILLHKISKLLHFFDSGFPIYLLKTRITVGGDDEESEEETTKIVIKERPRWGAELDHYFFPQQFRLNF